jgi:hypothetical protein
MDQSCDREFGRTGVLSRGSKCGTGRPDRVICAGSDVDTEPILPWGCGRNLKRRRRNNMTSGTISLARFLVRQRAPGARLAPDLIQLVRSLNTAANNQLPHSFKRS